jgi:hypothetical protein
MPCCAAFVLHLIFMGMCTTASSALAQSLPFFAADVPAHDTIFYAIPGQPFTALSNILVSDNDANGTAAGTIIRTGVVRIFRGTYIGSNPAVAALEPVCDPPSSDAATIERCKYFCSETPSVVTAGCSMWPASSQMAVGDATSFNYT